LILVKIGEDVKEGIGRKGNMGTYKLSMINERISNIIFKVNGLKK